MRSDLRADGNRCRACGAPLVNAEHVRTSWRTILTGEWAGERGEYVSLRCGCGRSARLLWRVEMAPYRGSPA